MTDWFTDELFGYSGAEKIVPEFSRLVCDVERYADTALETMEYYGMGVCYTKYSNGEALRTVNDEERERIIDTYYKPHHRRVENIINAQLDCLHTVFLVDCHSFSHTVLAHEKDTNRPDICIGTDDEHTPVKLVGELVKYFDSNGYSVAINSPFSGTLVPGSYKSNEHFKSIMLEINRNLYLDENYKKAGNFACIKSLITGALDIISNVESKDGDGSHLISR